MSNRLKNQLRYFFCAVNLIWFSVQLMAQEIADKRRNPVLGTNEYVNPVIQGFFTRPFLRLRVDKLAREFEYSYDNKHWSSAGGINDASYLSD